MIKLEQIQKNISEAITQSGLTQNEIAQKIGVKRPQISCYIHGKKTPSLDTFANLCAVLDVDPAELLCIAEYKEQ